MSTPRWQAEDETEPRSRAQAKAGQILVPKPANADEGLIYIYIFTLHQFPTWQKISLFSKLFFFFFFSW